MAQHTGASVGVDDYHRSATPDALGDDMIIETVRRLFARVLELDDVADTDDFFELGGTSLAVIELVAQIDHVLHADVPTDDVFMHPTPAELARCCTRQRGEDLVFRVGTSEGRPIHFIPTVDGEVGWFMKYLALVEMHRPAIGIRAPSLAGRPMPMDIESVARLWVDEIGRVQPNGPYTLGGYCAGGAIAWQVARELEALGEQVDTVVVFDAGEPEWKQWTLEEAVRFHLAELRERDPLMAVHPRFSLDDVDRWIAAVANPDPAVTTSPVERFVLRRLRTFWSIASATWNYHPRSLRAHGVLLWSTEFAPNLERRNSISKEWRMSCTSPRVETFDCTHRTMFENEDIRRIIAAI